MRRFRQGELLMCGIAGFVSARANAGREDMEAIARRMAASLRHRGPDDEGTWADPEAGIAFGHQRLAIVDLSPAGHQPMHSASGRYVIAYNGEIYNAERLKAELVASGRAPHFRGHSDTEVMLAAFDVWGVTAAVQKFNGMFAFALWDREQRVLFLCRDRMGEKPLYFGWCGDVFLFGSELKALRAHEAFDGEIDRNCVADFLRHAYVPTPRSIYRGISKLVPGTLVSVSVANRSPQAVAYWQLSEVAVRGMQQPFTGSEDDALAGLETLLRGAIGIRMLADVPLGAFLSGGIDSSTVVALMQAQSSRPVRTFTIALEQHAYNE